MDKWKGKILNAGGGLQSSASLLEMTEICQNITGNITRTDRDLNTRPADLRMYITDNSKILHESEWTPKLGVHDIFRDIYEWIHANESTLKRILQ